MSVQASQVAEQVRSAELVAALCLATDLGMGLPFEHGLHATLIAMRLGGRLSVDRATASQTYYACLLSHAGCTTDAHVTAEIFGDSLTVHFGPVMYGSGRDVLSGLVRALPQPDRAAPVRALQVARGLPKLARELRPQLIAACEVAGMLADRVGVPRRWRICSPSSPSAGTARDRSAAPRGADPPADADRSRRLRRRLPAAVGGRGARGAAPS